MSLFLIIEEEYRFVAFEKDSPKIFSRAIKLFNFPLCTINRLSFCIVSYEVYIHNGFVRIKFV